jgi:hypothetical protein
MGAFRHFFLSLLALFAAVTAMVTSASAQQQKPNILFIMADDIGWMQVQAYADGLGVGETPNIDRLSKEGARFVDYVAIAEVTQEHCDRRGAWFQIGRAAGELRWDHAGAQEGNCLGAVVGGEDDDGVV